MPMSAKQISVDQTLVWSKKSTSSALFHPATKAMRAANITQVRKVMLRIVGNSGNCEVKIGFQVSNKPDDEDSWGSVTTLAEMTNFLSIEGETYATAFETITTSLTQRFVRFGFYVQNSSGTGVESMYASMVIDLRGD